MSAIRYFEQIRNLIKKIFYLCLLITFKKKEYRPGIFVLGKEQLRKDQHFVFYLKNSEYMHPGDHLFFEPVIRWFKQMGMRVSVLPTSIMKSYFEINGYETNVAIQRSDVIITKPEMYFEIRCKSKNIVLVHTACPKINTPLINYLIESFSKLLTIEPESFFSFQYKPNSIKMLKNIDLKLLNNQKYVIFNNYVASGRFRIDKQKRNKINKFAKIFKERNQCKLIHVGSAGDQLIDKNYYDFIDLDLRGKTSINDLFYLASLPQVTAAISFDNFIMHLMALYEKKSFVLFRGRWTMKARDYHINCINPPFETEKKLIEYIQ